MTAASTRSRLCDNAQAMPGPPQPASSPTAQCRPSAAGRWDQAVRRTSGRPHYLDDFLGEMKRQAHLGLVQRWGGVPAGGRVLKTDLFEEATGPDAFLLDLRGAELLVGMDISREAAVRARRRDAEGRASQLVADVRALPFADGTFQLIVSPSTLDHFDNDADLLCSLRELARVLAPGGRLVITLDNRDNIFDPVLRLAARLGLLPYFLGRSFTAAELRSALEAAGLEVRDVTAILHNPRLWATGAVTVANWLGWSPLIGLVRRTLAAAQRLEGTRLRFRTGSFVAACAVKPGQST
jgi:SAM-dependent methyltransferase